MNDKKNVQVSAEKHYEKRWLEARKEIIRDADAMIDVLINVHEQCEATAEKHNVSPVKLTTWFFNQLPIDGIQLTDSDDDTPEDDE